MPKASSTFASGFADRDGPHRALVQSPCSASLSAGVGSCGRGNGAEHSQSDRERLPHLSHGVPQ